MSSTDNFFKHFFSHQFLPRTHKMSSSLLRHTSRNDNLQQVNIQIGQFCTIFRKIRFHLLAWRIITLFVWEIIIIMSKALSVHVLINLHCHKSCITFPFASQIWNTSNACTLTQYMSELEHADIALTEMHTSQLDWVTLKIYQQYYHSLKKLLVSKWPNNYLQPFLTLFQHNKNFQHLTLFKLIYAPTTEMENYGFIRRSL